MSALEVYDTETGELVPVTMPAGARQLGVRVKPILRLAMGHKDERGYPVKDDHFTARGDDRAVAKFEAEYPTAAKRKAVEILLPSELDVALSIQYRAFKGGQNGEGGTLVAIGQTNFALRDYCGGADLVTVFNQDGTVDEVETGLDANTREPLDDAAKELGLELYTTLTAMMPGVLGFGSYFALTSKGKESTDNLWLKLRQLYGLFGSKITFAVKPQLVIRSSTARPVVQKKGEEPKRISTTIYVADIVVPETIDEMIGRLQARQAALGDPAVAIYGPRALDAGSPTVAAPAVEPEAAEEAAPGGSEGRASSAAPADAETDFSDEPGGAEPVVFDEDKVNEAAAAKAPSGVNKGLTLAEIAAKGSDGEKWLLWSLKKWASDNFRANVELFVQARVDSVWSDYQAWKAEQS